MLQSLLGDPFRYGLMVAGALFAVSFLVFIHEGGHFIVAKLFGVGVPVFSLGMGPRVAGFVYKGTDYRLSSLPIGGYVRMSGADPFGDEDPDAVVDPSLDFMQKPVWQRLLIMLAGPAANIILPVLVFTALYMAGEPLADSAVGTVSAHSPAAQVGLRSGDLVVAVDGQPIDVWEDLQWAMADLSAEGMSLDVQRDGQALTLHVPPAEVPLRGAGLADLSTFGMEWSRLSPRVGVDDPMSPMGRAGLQTGDYITEVDGAEIGDWTSLNNALAAPGQHRITYLRADQTQRDEHQATVSVTEWVPRAGDPWPNPWGITPVEVYIGRVDPGSAADEAGLQHDDRIWTVDGAHIADFLELKREVGRTVSHADSMDSAIRPLELAYLRDGELHTTSFSPRMREENGLGRTIYRPVMGVTAYPDSRSIAQRIVQYHPPHRAFVRGWNKTVSVARINMTALVGILTGQTRVTENLGGPVKIVQTMGSAIQAGWFAFANVLAAISLSLGIVNLLPVPVLDGGHIMFYAIELVRGRPLSLVMRERLQMVGVLMLVALLIVVTVSDVSKLIPGG